MGVVYCKNGGDKENDDVIINNYSSSYIKEITNLYQVAKERNSYQEPIFWRITDANLKMSHSSREELQRNLGHHTSNILSRSAKVFYQCTEEELQNIASESKINRKISAKEKLHTKLKSQGEFPTNAISDDDIKQQLMSVDPADPEIIWILDVIYESCANIEKGIPK
nr:4042_t:CDS:2 [Entrophospora candida]